MRQFSLRGMAAAIVLALQALTVAYSLGAPLASAHNAGEAGYCEARAGASDRGREGGGRDAGACLACQYCLGGVSHFLPPLSAGSSVHPRSFAAAEWNFGPIPAPGSDRALAHRARAPPAFA